MTSYHVFANDDFYGTYEAATAEAAMQACADEVGTEGNTDGMHAYEVGTNAQADEAAAQ